MKACNADQAAAPIDVLSGIQEYDLPQFTRIDISAFVGRLGAEVSKQQGKMLETAVRRRLSAEAVTLREVITRLRRIQPAPDTRAEVLWELDSQPLLMIWPAEIVTYPNGEIKCLIRYQMFPPSP